ncbi:MAG TPA: polysaccharide deacetylase family protein, partial [Longimicrobiales bacterium]|nr:polysaccharide deacetylase family protein [Longimicrobiales bacterium]
VSPGLLGADGTWWDLMGEAGMLNDDTRDAALHEFAGRREAVLQHAFGDAPAPHLPDSFGIATEAELRDRCGNGIVVGSHTWGHEFLPALPDDEFTSNLRETLRWLADFGASTSWLALPYGAGSLRQGEHALELGHTGVLRVRGGRWEDPCTRAAVPRINVPAGLSTRGLDIRTSGIR